MSQRTNRSPDLIRETSSTAGPAPRGLLAIAFAVVYLVWGSTYLAIRIAVESVPPFFMSATRFLVAGGLMLCFLRWRGAAWPTRRQWLNGGIAGALMLLGGNAVVGFAEKTVASNIAALMIAATPAWFALLNWARPGGTAPTGRVALGIMVGFSGVGWLVLHRSETSGQGAAFSLAGALILICASVLWASGSLFVKHTEKPSSPFVAAAVQMVAGGAVVLLVSLALGEGRHFDLATVSARSFWAWVYLIVFGSWLGYSAYNYLLTHVSSAAVSTYAFVNPVVAVVLGWWLAGESFDPRMLSAAAIIVVGVVIITWPTRLRPVDR